MTQSASLQRPAETKSSEDAAPARSSEPTSSQAGQPAPTPKRRVPTCAELDLLA